MLVDPIVVTYKAVSTTFGIRKELNRLNSVEILSFDVETRGLYSPEERSEAKEMLKVKGLNSKDKKDCTMISNSSGLSHPELVQTTHFIFGESKDFSTVLITGNRRDEQLVWDWLVKFKGTLRVWNALFDLKICHLRTGKFPPNYLDGMLILKTLVNDANNMNSRVGLKHVMGSYYEAAWSMFEDYDNPDLKDPKFLKYCAIDGASTYLAMDLIQEEIV